MRVPLEWLKEFVPVRLTPEKGARHLGRVGPQISSPAAPKSSRGPIRKFAGER